MKCCTVEMEPACLPLTKAERQAYLAKQRGRRSRLGTAVKLLDAARATLVEILEITNSGMDMDVMDLADPAVIRSLLTSPVEGLDAYGLARKYLEDANRRAGK